MSDQQKISLMDPVGELTGNELFETVQDGSNKKISLNNLFSNIPVDQTVGEEEVTNGTFDGNADDWESDGDPLPTGNWAYGTNNIVHTPGSTHTLVLLGNFITLQEHLKFV